MTTICYKDGVLAADTLVSNNGVISGRTSKIKEHTSIDGRKYYTVASGYLDECMAFHNWGSLEFDPKEKPKLTESGEFVWIDVDRKFIWHNQDLMPFEYKEHNDMWAIGSGKPIALGAMAAGATAFEACNIAADYDCYTARPIEQFVVGKKKEEPPSSE